MHQGERIHYKLRGLENAVAAAILHEALHHLRELPEMKRAASS